MQLLYFQKEFVWCTSACTNTTNAERELTQRDGEMGMMAHGDGGKGAGGVLITVYMLVCVCVGIKSSMCEKTHTVCARTIYILIVRTGFPVCNLTPCAWNTNMNVKRDCLNGFCGVLCKWLFALWAAVRAPQFVDTVCTGYFKRMFVRRALALDHTNHLYRTGCQTSRTVCPHSIIRAALRVHRAIRTTYQC